MQHLSSKKYEHLMHASEVFDGQNYQNPEALEALRGSDEVSADEMHRHLKRWSLIGAALRHELPERIDLNFSEPRALGYHQLSQRVILICLRCCKVSGAIQVH